MVEGGPKVALLGYDFWVDRYGLDTDPIGDVLTLSGDPHEVVGVLPEGFEFLSPNQDVWVPLSRSAHGVPRVTRAGLLAIGSHDAPAATMEQVREDDHRDRDGARARSTSGTCNAEWTADTYNLRYRRTRTSRRRHPLRLPPGLGAPRPTHRVREHHQPAPRSRSGAEPGDRAPNGAGRRTWEGSSASCMTESSLMVAGGSRWGESPSPPSGVRLMARRSSPGVLPSTWNDPARRESDRVHGWDLGTCRPPLRHWSRRLQTFQRKAGPDPEGRRWPRGEREEPEGR